jgi:hypothetical protein
MYSIPLFFKQKKMTTRRLVFPEFHLLQWSEKQGLYFFTQKFILTQNT